MQVAQVFQNPDFDYGTVDYDISVLELASSLSFGSAIAPVILPYWNQPIIAGIPTVVTGWGALREGGSSPTQLQVVEVPLVSLEDCRSAYGTNAITDRMVCAGFPEGGKDACQVRVLIRFTIKKLTSCYLLTLLWK